MVAATKRIAIEPVTRVEGHGKVTLLLDEDNNVSQARLHIVEFRGFERFIQGRMFWEMPVAVQRLCGICPVSHHLCAAKAVDWLVGGEKLTPTAEKMRRLMHYGQFFQSHALHFFHLASPDLLFGFDADPAIRNVIGVAGKYPDLAKQGILMRKYGQEVIKATAGKKIHGTGAIPGGINKNLSIAERDELLKDLDQMLEWGRGAVKIAKDYTVENLETGQGLRHLRLQPPLHHPRRRRDGPLQRRSSGRSTPRGTLIFDHVDNFKYLDYIAEEVRPWSYMKFPFIKSIGPKDGWYRVGPLARVNACDFIDTPEAEAARKEFMAVTERQAEQPLAGLPLDPHDRDFCTRSRRSELLHDSDLQGDRPGGEGRTAQRGHRRSSKRRAERCSTTTRSTRTTRSPCANLIVSTTSNNEPMNRAVRGGRPAVHLRRSRRSPRGCSTISRSRSGPTIPA